MPTGFARRRDRLRTCRLRPGSRMMGYMAVLAGGAQPTAYGYGYGPPPGQGYYPRPATAMARHLAGLSASGPAGYPSYPPGPPPVAPTPQGSGQGSWNTGQDWRQQQPSASSNQSQKKGLLSHLWGD